MRLDATDLRYVTPDEFRVLTAVEIGSKNHEVVPTSLIAEISGVRGGNVNKSLGALAKRDLVARVQNIKYDGYRLTYGGLDYLALRTFSRRKPPSVASVGKKVGVGKESDIYVVKDDLSESRILKLHRLGRISFRAIKSKRDYLGKRKSASWMYMSRLGAQKEFAFMKVLYQHGFPVPIPIDQARHCIVMSLIDGYPLRQIHEVPSPAELYSKLMSLILELAHCGLIHGDFNEFNIIIKRKDGEPIIIDFPQMVSTRHENAEYFFNRDVNCIRKFFRKRFHFEGTTWPTWKDVLEVEDDDTAISEEEEEGIEEEAKLAGVDGTEDASHVVGQAESSQTARKRVRLDLEVEASGFGRNLQRELEDYMIEIQDLPDSEPEFEDGDEDQNEDEEESEYPDAKETEDETKDNQDAFDERQFQDKISNRLEDLRLSKALGNDEDYVSPVDSDLDQDEDDSDSDCLSDGPPQSDFTTYTRTKSSTPRPTARKLEKKQDLLKSVVSKQIEKQIVEGKKGGNKAGKAKGHKWKSSAKYLVGNTNDGW